MCEQCMAEARMVKQDVIPGYILMQSTKGTKHWPEGHYGLVVLNDPLLVWEGLPASEDPLFGLSNEELDGVWDEDPSWGPSEAFMNFAMSRRDQFRMGPLEGYQFVKACSEVGFNPEADGDPVIWFFGYMMTQLRKDTL